MEEPYEMVREGLVTLNDGETQAEVRLTATSHSLLLHKEEIHYATQEEADKAALLQKIRNVTLYREPSGGLGLSVKGGAEHKLPVLISRIVKGHSADKSGQVFVGDAILKVNGLDMEDSTHDQMVKKLKSAGDIVTLTVKHFKPASHFLNKGNKKKRSNDEINSALPEADKRWIELQSIPLAYAYLTRYIRGTDKLRSNGFEVFTPVGKSSGVINCDDNQTLSDWVAGIHDSMNASLDMEILEANKAIMPSDQIVHMGWVFERVSPTQNYQSWKARFLVLKGAEVCLYDSPPSRTSSGLRWPAYIHSNKIYESTFKILKPLEHVDDRCHCFIVQFGNGETLYMNADRRADLLQLEKAWHQANHHAVFQVICKTFGCYWRGRLSGLTLDLNHGFSLYESQSKSFMWNYKFSQLKGSSDDGKTKLKLHFQNETKEIETREIECSTLRVLLFTVHAFLSAKLASVDPAFLQNL